MKPHMFALLKQFMLRTGGVHRNNYAPEVNNDDFESNKERILSISWKVRKWVQLDLKRFLFEGKWYQLKKKECSVRVSTNWLVPYLSGSAYLPFIGITHHNFTAFLVVVCYSHFCNIIWTLKNKKKAFTFRDVTNFWSSKGKNSVVSIGSKPIVLVSIKVAWAQICYSLAKSLALGPWSPATINNPDY